MTTALKSLTLGILFFSVSSFAGEGADIVVSAEEAMPFVHAAPGFSELGSVKAPGQRMATVTFYNSSNEPVNGFHTWCSGDLSVYSCSSLCGYLPAYGSCSVLVTFHPRFSDGMRKSVTVQGMGSGVWAQAYVAGTDAK